MWPPDTSSKKRRTRANAAPEDDGNETEPASSSDEENDNDGLLEENRVLKAKLKAAEAQLKKVAEGQSADEKRRYSQGKGRYLRRVLGNEDSGTQEIIADYWKNLIPFHKTFDERDKEYSEDPTTPCGIIMKDVICPSGETKKSYWERVIRYAVLYKKQQLCTKMLRKQQGGYLGNIALLCTPCHTCVISVLTNHCAVHCYYLTGLALAGRFLLSPETLLEMIKRDIDDAATWRAFFRGDFNAKYIEFLHEMTLCMVDMDEVKRKLLKGKNVLEIVTASDEGQAAFNYINNHDKWLKRHQERENRAHPIHRDRSGGKYSTSKGRGRFKSGYTAEGTALNAQAVAFFKKARTMTAYLGAYKKSCEDWYGTSALKSRVEAGAKKKKGRAGQINAPAESMPALSLPEDVLAMMEKRRDEADDSEDEEVGGGGEDFDESMYEDGSSTGVNLNV